jgi:hypothetical protein
MEAILLFETSMSSTEICLNLLKYADFVHDHLVLTFLYNVDVGSVAGVSEAIAASVFRVEVAGTSEPLETRPIFSLRRSRRAE